MVQVITPKITEIKNMPTVQDNVHESVYKAHSTLMLIMDMVHRGDSKETIWNVYDEIYNSNNNFKGNAYTETTGKVTTTTIISDDSTKKTVLHG